MSLIQEIVPALFLLVAALLVFGGSRIARQFGLPEGLGCGVALCTIAIAIGLSPVTWRATWAGGNWGDRLLTSVRIVGLTGMLFLAGTRFNFDQSRRKLLILGFALSAGVLFVVVILLLKLPSWPGPIVLVAATIVASSLWLPSELARFDKEDNDLLSDWHKGAVVFTALAMLAVYFYDIFAIIRHGRSASTSVYIIVGLYESVKLLVLFAFAYFISTRFLIRAEGRISATRTTTGFVFIAALIFGLVALTTSQLGAIAWAFVAGVLWRRSEIGKRFVETETTLASATLISFVFLSVLLQSHGRRLTGFLALIIAVLAVMVLKWICVLVGMRLVGASSSHAVRLAAVMVGPGEVAILFLGFGMTRWLIDAPVFFGIFLYGLLSMLFIPLLWHFVTVDEDGVGRELEAGKPHAPIYQ